MMLRSPVRRLCLTDCCYVRRRCAPTVGQAELDLAFAPARCRRASALPHTGLKNLDPVVLLIVSSLGGHAP